MARRVPNHAILISQVQDLLPRIFCRPAIYSWDVSVFVSAYSDACAAPL